VTVLSRWLGAALLNRAGRLVALLALEKQLHAFATAEATLFTSISSQLDPPMLLDSPAFWRATAVMRYGRHIANKADINTG
jgi:hypothetical protein